jgi:hypothetical protein
MLSAGLRQANLRSKTDAHIFGVPNWNFGSVDKYGYYYTQTPTTHYRYDAKISADRKFKGAGPVVSWEASKNLFGNKEVGVAALDWALSGGVLFGDRKTTISGLETAEYFTADAVNFRPAFPTTTTTTPVAYHRSKSVTVPTYGASLGMSYKVDRFKVDAGYRWERYQDAIDGGYAQSKAEDRTIDGPYFKVSVGFGG